jgi:type IV pilus assembly protein PilA
MKNKGFSLVELIIVIAIMAILAAAIAPALIRYIDKSRRSDDVAAGESINTAVQSALSNEEAYDEIMPAMPTSAGTNVVIASAQANGSTPFSYTGTSASNSAATFLAEVNSSVGGNAPKIKFKKAFTSGTTGTPGYWTIGVNDAGKPVVWLGIGSGDTEWMIQPDICANYK